MSTKSLANLLRESLFKQQQRKQLSQSNLDEIFTKLENQLNVYHKLPSLTQKINHRLMALLPKYNEVLDTTKSDGIQRIAMKFMPKNNQLLDHLKIDNLKAYIIKHELQNEYISIRSLRKSSISIDEDPEISMEYTVQTYGITKMIQFAKLLNDDVFFHSSYVNYYKRLIKLFSSIVSDENISKGRGFCRKLRPEDLEKLIKFFIYSNVKLTLNERKELNLSKANNLLIADLKKSGLKLTNKELFSLLELSFIESKDSEDSANSTVRLLYKNFKNSSTVEKSTEFFKSFLNYNMSLSSNDPTIYDKEFVHEIIEDLLDSNVTSERSILKYILKYGSLIKDGDLVDAINQFIIQSYCLDNYTLEFMNSASSNIDSNSDTQKFINELYSLYTAKTTARRIPEIDMFQLRLLDHLLMKEQHSVPGFVFQQHGQRHIG